MEEFNTSPNPSYANTTLDCSDCNSADDSNVLFVVTCVTVALCLPLTVLAAYSLFSVVRKDGIAPVYVINVLVSDLVQLCCMAAEVALAAQAPDALLHIYYYGVMAGVGFMVCVALERYLLIVWPLWYRFRRTVKLSLVVSAMVWALPLIYILPVCFNADFQVQETILAVFFLLPYPLLMFFLGGTVKALYAAMSVSPDEKRRIVAVLVLVLLIYMLIFLPTAIWSLAEEARQSNSFSDLSVTVVNFSPFADLFLYVFLKKGGPGDQLLAILCCCTMESDDVGRPNSI